MPQRLIGYDLYGWEMATLVDHSQAADQHTVTFEAVDLPSGVYFYRIEVGAFTQTRRMILLQ